MIEKKTVFIIGAGASHEIGFPLGTGLCNAIRDWSASLIREDSSFLRRLQSEEENGVTSHDFFRSLLKKYSLNEVGGALTRISDNITIFPSLDEYLNANDSELNILICKALLIDIIRHSEFESKHNSYSNVDKNFIPYYPKLFRLLLPAINKDKNIVSSIFENVSFIIFNYDRSLENYFFEKLKGFEFLDEQSRVDIMRSLYIHHPYGQIGKLPWQDNPKDEVILSYGHHPGYASLFEILPQIRTYREEISDNTSVEESRRRLKEAEQIVFLGFGFHNQNMELLRYEQVNFNSKPIFLTTMGKVSDNTYEKMKICKKIIDVFNFEKSQYSNNSFNNFYPAESCSALFDTYERGIL